MFGCISNWDSDCLFSISSKNVDLIWVYFLLLLPVYFTPPLQSFCNTWVYVIGLGIYSFTTLKENNFTVSELNYLLPWFTETPWIRSHACGNKVCKVTCCEGLFSPWHLHFLPSLSADWQEQSNTVQHLYRKSVLLQWYNNLTKAVTRKEANTFFLLCFFFFNFTNFFWKIPRIFRRLLQTDFQTDFILFLNPKVVWFAKINQIRLSVILDCESDVPNFLLNFKLYTKQYQIGNK